MLVEVSLAGVDGSDIHMLRGELNRINRLAPVILGDEIVGGVVAIGERAAARRGLAVGDRVIVEARWPCDGCRACLEGQYYLCERDGQGEGGYGYGWISCAEPPHLWGGYATHVFVPSAALVHPIPAALDERAALVCASVLANSHRWTRKAGIRPADTVVVLGPGPQGIGCAIAARLRGAEVALVGLERDAARLDVAADLGVARALALPKGSAAAESAAAVARLVGDEPIDVVIDATGAGPAKELALDLVRPLGTIVNAGVPAPARAPIDWLRVLLKEVTIVSPLSHPHSVEPALRIGSELLERGLDPGRLISHVFPLAEAERALRAAAYELDERPTKVAISPAGERRSA
jgi:alcohol dehydrogenase